MMVESDSEKFEAAMKAIYLREYNQAPGICRPSEELGDWHTIRAHVANLKAENEEQDRAYMALEETVHRLQQERDKLKNMSTQSTDAANVSKNGEKIDVCHVWDCGKDKDADTKVRLVAIKEEGK